MSPARRPCIEDGCLKPVIRDARCLEHANARDAARGRRQERGYGAAHARVRARLVRGWLAAMRRGQTWFCPRCGQPLRPGQPVDADHYGQTLAANPDAQADRLAHAACNRGARPLAPEA